MTEVLELADGAAAGVLGGAFAQVPRREARPPTPLMLAYIDSHKDEFGIEPISTTLQVAPLTYYAAKKRLPSARALRDAVLLPLLMTLWVAHRNQHAPSFRRVPFPARTRAAPDSFTDPRGIQRQRRLFGDLMRRLAVLIAVLGLLLGVLTASAASAVSSATVTRFTDAVKVKGVRSKVHPIRLAAGTAVKATLSWGAPHGNLDLTLRNPAGKAVASSTTRRPELVAVRVPTTGTWSLVVWARQGGSGYVLNVGQTTSSTPTPTAATPAGGSKPPAGGYFTALPPLAALPSDSECARRIRRSTWEPRPENARANATHPPTSYVVNGYSVMQNRSRIWGRVTGQASGTTDELIQHYACKWGLPDDLMRAEMVAESYWYQGQKDSNGNPINGRGYGDFGHCSGGPYGSSGPASLGVMQIKWCAHPGTLPYSQTSTAFNLDYYGALIRGCYNGWDYVTSNRGDLWGCVGRWYSGGWYDSGARNYIATVQRHHRDKPWLRW